jgi:hypothetical protein
MAVDPVPSLLLGGRVVLTSARVGKVIMRLRKKSTDPWQYGVLWDDTETVGYYTRAQLLKLDDGGAIIDTINRL